MNAASPYMVTGIGPACYDGNIKSVVKDREQACMARVYKKPPVVEAVCEFRFDNAQPWDLTIPGLLFREISSEFPILEQTAILQISPYSVGGDVPSTQMQQGVRFLTADRTELIQVSSHMLSIHQLRPYRSWEYFKARISSTLDTYCAISKSEALSRIGLRYVDRVELPPGRYELDDYFRVMPRAPEPIPQVFASFLEQMLIPYGQDPQQPERWLRLTFGTAEPEQPEHLAFVLDLDMSTPATPVPQVADVMNWLDPSHEHIEQAFDAAFTEKTHKKVFEEVQL